MALKMKSPLDHGAADLIAGRFRALSDPTRLRILDQLRQHREVSVGQLTEVLGGSQQNISKHLSALHAGGFVDRRKQGTSTLYRISDPAVIDLCDSVCAAIETQLTEMGALLAE